MIESDIFIPQWQSKSWAKVGLDHTWLLIRFLTFNIKSTPHPHLDSKFLT